MKTIFRFFNLSLLTAGVMAAGTTATLAQDPCADIDGQTAVYTKFTELYPKTALADRKAAIDAGKQFLEKYGSCETVKEQADYLKGAVPKMEESYNKGTAGAARSAVLKRFDAAIPAKNWDEAYAAGNEFVSKYPNDAAQINIIIPLGLIGLIESYNKNFKYNDDSVKYAKMVINQLNANVKATKKNKAGVDAYGAFQFEGTKEDVLSDMNYALAYITYHVKGDKKGALPFYYEVAQKPGKNQKEPRVYGSIGDYYLEQRTPIGKEIADLIAKQKDPKETDEAKLAREGEIKAKIAMFNGLSERALDSFARAYKAAPDTPANKAYRDGLYKTLQGLYEQRFEKKDGLETYIASTVAKPLPNPTSEVTPVADPEPVKPTTTTTSTAPAAVKPAATVPTKPVSAVPAKISPVEKTAVTAPSNTATAVKAKTVKRPVVRKKRT